jgi:hypothetical protein
MFNFRVGNWVRHGWNCMKLRVQETIMSKLKRNGKIRDLMEVC